MTHPRKLLTGLHAWTAGAWLTALVTAVIVGQLPTASAGSTDDLPAPAAANVLTLTPAPADGLDIPTVPVVPDPPVAPPAPVLPPVAAPAAPPAAPQAPAPQPAAAKAAPKAAPAPPAAVQIAAAKPAPASDLCSGAGWEQRRGQAALASLKGGAPRTGFSVSFHSARSGVMGMTFLNERRIEMYVRSCDKQPTELLRHVMAHELGHAWDTTQMSGVERAGFMAARGIPATTGWYGCSGCSDFATPAGDFAEVYAQWARGASSNKSLIAGDVGGAQLSALAARFFGA